MTQAEHLPGGRRFWLGAVTGAAIVGVALFELATTLKLSSLFNLALVLGGSGVGHDALWAPAVVAVALLTRRLPEWVRGPVRLGLVLTAVLLLFAWPELHGYAGHARNPSAGPLDYHRNVSFTLLVLWATIGGVCTYRKVQLRRTRIARRAA